MRTVLRFALYLDAIREQRREKREEKQMTVYTLENSFTPDDRPKAEMLLKHVSMDEVRWRLGYTPKPEAVAEEIIPLNELFGD